MQSTGPAECKKNYSVIYAEKSFVIFYRWLHASILPWVSDIC